MTLQQYIMKKISEYSNSEMGSGHWLNTILSRHLHIGEFMRDRGHLTEIQCRNWGETIMIQSRELLDWFSINTPESIEFFERDLLDRLKKKYEE